MRSPDGNQTGRAIEFARGYMDMDSPPEPLPHEFYQAVEAVAFFLNKPAADDLLGPSAKGVRERMIPLLRQGRPPKRERRRPRADPQRELRITGAVAHVCYRFGLAPTRNPATRGVECGASIVRKALLPDVKRSERTIANIFGRHRHLYDELFKELGWPSI
jgi:hypothetical protein